MAIVHVPAFPPCCTAGTALFIKPGVLQANTLAWAEFDQHLQLRNDLQQGSFAKQQEDVLATHYQLPEGTEEGAGVGASGTASEATSAESGADLCIDEASAESHA